MKNLLLASALILASLAPSDGYSQFRIAGSSGFGPALAAGVVAGAAVSTLSSNDPTSAATGQPSALPAVGVHRAKCLSDRVGMCKLPQSLYLGDVPSPGPWPESYGLFTPASQRSLQDLWLSKAKDACEKIRTDLTGGNRTVLLKTSSDKSPLLECYLSGNFTPSQYLTVYGIKHSSILRSWPEGYNLVFDFKE